jgi:hypothetical protein
MANLEPTAVYDSYWRFAAERLAAYYRHLVDPIGPWTDDPIIQHWRFCNTYRAADRISQYLIREVQYGEGRSQAPDELFFRTLLFKIFNKIETWQLLEADLGPIVATQATLERAALILSGAMARRETIYSAAYIMSSPPFGAARKHENHLLLLSRMLSDGLPCRIAGATSLSQVYEMLHVYAGLGSFLAFQYALDLNYSSLLAFGESEFVVAGPGALDGISKCFSDTGGATAEDVIREMWSRQDAEFDRLGLDFPGLFGRPLQLNDCQGLFCEISKYSRASHPDIVGRAGRSKIKQTYRPLSAPMPTPFFPPRWGLNENITVRPPTDFSVEIARNRCLAWLLIA